MLSPQTWRPRGRLVWSRARREPTIAASIQRYIHQFISSHASIPRCHPASFVDEHQSDSLQRVIRLEEKGFRVDDHEIQPRGTPVPCHSVQRARNLQPHTLSIRPLIFHHLWVLAVAFVSVSSDRLLVLARWIAVQETPARGDIIRIFAAWSYKYGPSRCLRRCFLILVGKPTQNRPLLS